MKKFTLSSSRILFSLVALLLATGFSSCSNQAQQFLFSNHPTEYKKAEKTTVATATPDTPALTASITAQPELILPANAYAQEQIKTEALATELLKAKNTASTQKTEKISLKEKAGAVKKAMKEVKAARKELKQIEKLEKKNAKAAGPVSNDVAIKIILVGLILALLGLVLPVLYGLGGLVVVIGLVLLLINYL